MRLHRALFMGLIAWSAVAAPLTVSSYSTPNGAIGSFNYEDTSYLPCVAADCTTTGAALSGGTGKLTDGVSPTLDWFQQGQNTSWVGWDSGQGLSNPTVTFFFAQPVTINTVTVWESNSRTGGVAQPASITIAGVNNVLASDTVNTTPHALTFSGLNISGSSVTVQFNQSAGFQWVMIGEVSFAGTVGTATPEPGTLALLLTAMLVCVVTRRWLGRRA